MSVLSRNRSPILRPFSRLEVVATKMRKCTRLHDCGIFSSYEAPTQGYLVLFASSISRMVREATSRYQYCTNRRSYFRQAAKVIGIVLYGVLTLLATATREQPSERQSYYSYLLE